MIPSIYKKIIKFIILISLVLIVAIIFFEAGKAEVKVKIKNQEREINFATPVSLTGENNSLPGKILQTTVEKTKKFNITPGEIPETTATGLVIIYNNNNSSQALVATTRLMNSDGLIFRIENSVNLPAGGQIEVAARADEAGDKYLIGPAKFTIPGLGQSLQSKIYAESNAPMVYKKNTKYQLTAEIYNESKNQLLEEIKAAALLEFEKNLKVNEIIKNDALAVEILEEESSVPIGDEVKDFEITLKTKIKTLAFDENELKQMVIKELTDSLAPGDKIEYENPELALHIELYPEEKENIAVITGQYQVKIINADINLDSIKGLTKDSAEKTLRDLSNVETAQIYLWPFWVTKVPENEKKIEVIIE